MTDALHPLARMLGDVKFHSHGRVRSEAAERKQGRFPEEKLGAPTRALAEHLGYTLAPPGKRRNTALFPLQVKGSRPPFFCVHAAGGAIACYRELAKHLGEDQPFYAFRSPGSRRRSAPFGPDCGGNGPPLYGGNARDATAWSLSFGRLVAWRADRDGDGATAPGRRRRNRCPGAYRFAPPGTRHLATGAADARFPDRLFA